MSVVEIPQEPQTLDEDEGVMSPEEIEQIIAHYEQVYQMTSEEFLQQRREGTAPDTFETMNWMMLLKYR